jgi:hypothetical protein
MKARSVMVGAVFAFLSMSLGAQAQGVVDGAEHGAAVGNRQLARSARWLVARSAEWWVESKAV